MSKLPIPPKHIYDPSFSYVPASRSDIRQTFARIRSQLNKQVNKVRRVK